jgi:hypothetical protein
MLWYFTDSGGIGRLGLTSRLNVSPVRMRPFTIRTAPIEMISSPSDGRRPVVSVSKTT